MEFRHEWKHEISPFDRILLRQRLGAVMQPDPHAPDGRYHIRSLYFDDFADTALREKLDGVCRREKFRLRLYNGDTGFIRLEKKTKQGGLGNKQSVRLSEEEARRLLDGDTDWICGDRPLLMELREKMKKGLRPKTIVDYTREAFVFPAGNVRVTLDYDIRTGLGGTDFLDKDCLTVPAKGDPAVLEVKWDEFLPTVIRHVVQTEGRRTAAFSKYALCRMYD